MQPAPIDVSSKRSEVCTSTLAGRPLCNISSRPAFYDIAAVGLELGPCPLG